jgi:hypothetical protein
MSAIAEKLDQYGDALFDLQPSGPSLADLRIKVVYWSGDKIFEVRDMPMEKFYGVSRIRHSDVETEYRFHVKANEQAVAFYLVQGADKVDKVQLKLYHLNGYNGYSPSLPIATVTLDDSGKDKGDNVHCVTLPDTVVFRPEPF